MFEIKNDKIETVNKTFRIPKELMDRLEVTAQQKEISVNNLVCQCCEYALRNQKPETSKIEK
jgi:HicB family.